MNIFKDNPPHCVDYTGSKKTGPERVADVQQLHPGATYYANPSERCVYKGTCVKYRTEVYCGWIACIYERRKDED